VNGLFFDAFIQDLAQTVNLHGKSRVSFARLGGKLTNAEALYISGFQEFAGTFRQALQALPQLVQSIIRFGMEMPRFGFAIHHGFKFLTDTTGFLALLAEKIAQVIACDADQPAFHRTPFSEFLTLRESSHKNILRKIVGCGPIAQAAAEIGPQQRQMGIDHIPEAICSDHVFSNWIAHTEKMPLNGDMAKKFNSS